MVRRPRSAFSLLEIIIATAILAGSAMVLFSLLGLGTKYGNRAEERTSAMVQAQSLLDEFMARWPNMESKDREEVTGVLPSNPPRSFRIEFTPYQLSSTTNGSLTSNAANALPVKLFRVTVELFDKANAPGLGTDDSEPLCRLTRLVRKPAESPSENTSQRIPGGQ